MRSLIIFLASFGLYLLSALGSSATTVNYYFATTALQNTYVDDFTDMSRSERREFMQFLRHQHDEDIIGFRAFFSIDWDLLGPRANRNITAWNPQTDAPDWLLAYTPPGSGWATGDYGDMLSFRTNDAGHISFLEIFNWGGNGGGEDFTLEWGRDSGLLRTEIDVETYFGYAGFYGAQRAKMLQWADGETAPLLYTNWQPAPVPLPAPALLLLSALMGLVGLRRARAAG